MKYSYTFAALAIALSAVTVNGAPFENAAHPQERGIAAELPHALMRRLVQSSVSSEHKNESSNSDGTFGGDTVNSNPNASSSALQNTDQSNSGNNYGGGNGYGGKGGDGAHGGGSDFNCNAGKRGLAWRRAFAERRDQNSHGNGAGGNSYDSGNWQSHDSHNIDNSVDSHDNNQKDSHNNNAKVYNGGGGGGNVKTQNGGYASNTCFSMRRGLVGEEMNDHANGLAVLRSLGALTERDVEDPLEALAARDVGFSARMLGVEGHDESDGAQRRSFTFEDGLARRDGNGLAIRCAEGSEGCSVAMRREAEEMLREHAMDLGFHF